MLGSVIENLELSLGGYGWVITSALLGRKIDKIQFFRIWKTIYVYL